MGLLSAFTVIFVWLRPIIGSSASMLMVLPPTVAAWLLGVRGGLIFSLVTFIISIWLTVVLGFGDIVKILIENGAAIGLLILGFTSVTVGSLGSILRKRRSELEKYLQLDKERNKNTEFLSLLNDILSNSLEAENLAEMLDVLVNRMGRLFDADNCFITRWDEVQQMAIPTAVFGSLEKSEYLATLPKPGEISLTRSVLEAGQPLAVEDVHHTPLIEENVAMEYPSHSALGLPLLAGDRKLGAVILGFNTPRHFSEDEIERGKLAAREISLAMVKVLAAEEADRRAQEMAGLYEVSQAFSLHGDPRVTYSLLTERLANILGAKMCLIALNIAEANEICARVPAYGLSDESASKLHYPAVLGGNIWDFKKKDVFKANHLAEIPAEFTKIASELAVESVIVAPLWNANRDFLGLIFAANKPGGFRSNDGRLMKILASQASVVIQNMELLTAERRRTKELAVLQEVAVATTDAVSEKELLERVSLLIGKNLYPDNFGILILDEVDEVLQSHTSYYANDKEVQLSVPIGKGITGQVAASGQAMRVGNVTDIKTYIPLNEQIRSELCVPLKIGDHVIGVANAESVIQNAFTQDNEGLLTIIASQLAMAIERLRAEHAEYRQTTEIMRSNALIKVLAQVGARTSATPELDVIVKTLGSELSKLGMTCMVALAEPDEHNFRVYYTSIPRRVTRLLERVSKQKIQDFKIDPEQLHPLIGSVREPVMAFDPIAIARQILVDFPANAIEKFFRPLGVTETMPVCQLPLIYEEKLLGVLWLWGEGLRQSDLPTMSIFSIQVATALQNAKLMSEVKRLAITDEGTNIFNRRHFFHLAEQEFSRSGRYNHPLAAMIIDVDVFKRFNDRYGHIVGDQVLYAIAQTLKQNLREIDILGRYGGEEFAVLLPVTDLAAAQRVAERLQTRVANTKVPTDAGPLSVTISVGLAIRNQLTPTLLSLIDLADQAMYIAKNAGGNRVAAK